MFLIKTIIKNKINEWFKKDPKLLEYKITEFENTIIVGKPVNLEKLTDFLSCEICGYKTLYEEDLFIHRYTHAGLWFLLLKKREYSEAYKFLKYKIINSKE